MISLGEGHGLRQGKQDSQTNMQLGEQWFSLRLGAVSGVASSDALPSIAGADVEPATRSAVPVGIDAREKQPYANSEMMLHDMFCHWLGHESLLRALQRERERQQGGDIAIATYLNIMEKKFQLHVGEFHRLRAWHSIRPLRDGGAALPHHQFRQLLARLRRRGVGRDDCIALIDYDDTIVSHDTAMSEGLTERGLQDFCSVLEISFSNF